MNNNHPSIMVFTEWVKMSHFDYDDFPHDFPHEEQEDAGSQAAVIGIHGEEAEEDPSPPNLKETPTHDMDSCPSADDAIEHGLERKVVDTDTSSSMGDPGREEEIKRQGRRDRRRRTILWIGVCCIMVLAAGIGAGVALVMMKGDNDSTTTSTNEQEAENDFDFSDLGEFPSQAPSSQPVVFASAPVSSATIEPSVTTTVLSSAPSAALSSPPSAAATVDIQRSALPSDVPSVIPSSMPTGVPTSPVAPVSIPPVAPTNATSSTLMTFCVIADVPYTSDEADDLPTQLATQMDGCEFLVHLGDLFIGDTFCDESLYLTARDLMLASPIPTFVVIGDNEWNDCQRETIDVGWGLWNTHFLNFHDNWNHTFFVIRQPGYEENFAFIHKRTLIIALNLVGGRVHNGTEWETRLVDEFAWTKSIMDMNLLNARTADGVILLGHAKPKPEHQSFFDPFQAYMEYELLNRFPVLYLHGDGHSWMYTPNYDGQSNLLRIQHEGGTNEPILKVYADPATLGPSVYSSFQYDRQIDVFGARPKPDSDTGGD